MAIDFPATRWSLIARLPGRPHDASVILGLYADCIGDYVQARLAGESPDRIADIVQDVLLDLLARPEALAKAAPGGGSRFRHWLMHLAWQSAIDHLRRLRRRDLPAITSEAAGAEHDPAMDRAWALSVVRQAIADVDAACADGRLDRDAGVVLRDNLIDGRNLRDIATRTGLSLATCSRRLAAARAHLRRSISERLRLAGELGPDEDERLAGDRLLACLGG